MDWYSEDTATFGDRIAGAREANGLSQGDLSEKLGVKKSVIEAWENDVKEPRANRLQMVCGVLGVSVSWLLTGEGDGPTSPDQPGALPAGMNDLFAELRDLRDTVGQAAERISQLERRLRAAVHGEIGDE